MLLVACSGDDNDSDAGQGSSEANEGSPKVGGTLIWQSAGDTLGGLELIKTFNPAIYQLASLTHDGLLDFAYGQPGNPGIGFKSVPSLASSLPEVSPDKLTLTFKLRPAKFHNGRALTSEDAKWTYDTLAFSPESGYRQPLSWLESTQAPDPSTFVVKARFPNADAIAALTFYSFGAILAREHHESGAAEKSLLGSGPFRFFEYTPSVLLRYARNPDYATEPGKPYFEIVTRLGNADPAKKLADVLGSQVHLSSWFIGAEREQVKRQKPELQVFQYPTAGSGSVYIRNDVPPYNDKRVRQALSMGYDRKLLSDAVADGEGKADQALSRTGEAWEFRGPEQLLRADLYMLNLAESRKLLAAASVSLPLKANMPTWNAQVIGQRFVDEIHVITTQWRNNGLVEATLVEDTPATSGPRSVGNYEALQWAPNAISTIPAVGIAVRNRYFAPPGGATVPTMNICYVNNSALNSLLDKQLGEFDRAARIAAFHQIEEIVSEEMVHTSGVTASELAYFVDPAIKNAQMPRDAYSGSVAWIKHWYFG
jgi:ABC-type transport system substrate-binding protein